MSYPVFLNKHIMYVTVFFVTIITFCSTNTTEAQSRPLEENSDTIGIRITLKEFNRFINKIKQQSIDSSFTRDTQFYVLAIRLRNTISKNDLVTQYLDFDSLYNKSIFPRAIEFLLPAFYKGGALYCPTLNLFIGGPSHPNSQFNIIDMNKKQ